MKRNKPNLLFLSPVVPAESGNGLAMRAALFLEALSRDFDVHLQIIPVSGPADPKSIPPFVKGFTHAVHILDLERHLDPHFALIQRLKEGSERHAALKSYPRPVLSRFSTSVAIDEACGVVGDVSFSIVHVMRLYLAPFATPYLNKKQNRPHVILDLDDNEVQTRERLSALLASNGTKDAAELEVAEAQKYRDYERTYLSKFDEVFVCSQSDEDNLKSRHGLRHTNIVPNAVRPIRKSHSPNRDGVTILFVGTMGYYPNEDAAHFFCRDVLPKIQPKMQGAVSFVIGGSNPPDRIRQLADIPGVTVTGTVPDVTPLYDSADLVVVPIRAGGGTRIKILESFAHGVPVVSTSLGAEGLAVTDGEHIVLADSAEEFAERCVTLIDNKALAQRISANAHSLFAAAYATDVVVGRIADLYKNLLASRNR